MPKKLDIKIGDKYNRLTIIKELDRFITKSGNKYRQVECKCNCGNIKIYPLGHLTSGKTKSCGCLAKESTKIRNSTHGMTKTKLFDVWQNMRQRCNDINSSQYHRYGGRGIIVCKCWDKFKNFYKDMGPAYKEGLQIDRINNDGNYEKSNCRWVTLKENCRNRGNTLKYKGKPLITWAEELSIKYSTVRGRYYKGKTMKKALGL